MNKAFPSLCLLLTLLLTGTWACDPDAGITDKTVRVEVDSTAAEEAPADTVPYPPDIPVAIMKRLKPTDGFDYPVAPPNAHNYYKARGLIWGTHLGEDWNGDHGGNTDFGDFVYAAADGIVYFSEWINSGWGNVIRMIHNTGTQEKPEYVETVYAHVASMWARKGNKMKRGEVIGTIGSAKGKYHAHLHFEIRAEPGKHIRAGYEGDTTGFQDPTVFIEARRPRGQRHRPPNASRRNK